MSHTEIQVVVKRPNESPFQKTIHNTLEGLQKEVGGDIECVRIGPFDLYCNENGKLIGLAPNLHLPHDVIVGTVVISRTDDNGDLVTLTDEQALTVMRLVKKMSVIIQTMSSPPGEN